ncbi:DUF2690 domain-containing protein [Streptomyces sp. NPDC059853]|uniref:DUF2690 domain-containing protein n=1 Tax=Streptomyces sp. NPDC059853 TaxID=3346973 RepID=UPI0036680BC2
MTGIGTGPGEVSPPRQDSGEPRATVPEPRTARPDTDGGDGPAAAGPWWQLSDGGRPRRAMLWLGGLAGAGAVAWVSAVSTGLGDRWVAEDPPVTCPGQGCDGRNPEAAGCGADAYSYRPAENNPVALQIRFNPACNAVWGKITTGETGDVVTAQVADGPVRRAAIDYDDDVFTRMTTVDNGAFTVTVCATPTARADRTGDWDPYCISASQDSLWH